MLAKFKFNSVNGSGDRMKSFFGPLILAGLFFVVPDTIFTVEGISITEKDVKSHNHTVENCYVYIATKKETYCEVVSVKS